MHDIEDLEYRLARIESLLSIGFAAQVSERREREDTRSCVGRGGIGCPSIAALGKVFAHQTTKMN